MPEFEIDLDIKKAWTLPSKFYTDEGYFELSKDRIFAKCWHFLGRVNGQEALYPAVILPGFLDEPILLSRSNGTLNCLSNVCTHRGKILVEKPCEANLIRCEYHGRRFSLDGKFLSMPEFDEAENFPSLSDDLHRYTVADSAGYNFVSGDPAAPFNEFVGEARHSVLRIRGEDLQLKETKTYDVAAHWALYCENYLEGFHIPFVHKGLNDVVDYGTYRTETFRYSSLQTGYDQNGEIVGQYLFIFPNIMLNFYAWGLSVNIVEPVTPARSRIRYLIYVSDESKFGAGAGGDLHRVELEDEAVVESVQQGIRSRYYDRGRYSPTREQGTHHFHRLIAEFMGCIAV
ncbi:MAG TPA: SRPBCC family protein [Pyrinomonadaceae bacterium]|jgi:choline monooxygenase